jgi:hypothetical protein
MMIYKVQLVRDEQPDGTEQKVEARTEKEAAEKLFGKILFKQEFRRMFVHWCVHRPTVRLCSMSAESALITGYL